MMLGLGVDRVEDWNCGQVLDGAEIAVLPSWWELCPFKTSDSKYFLYQPTQAPRSSSRWRDPPHSGCSESSESAQFPPCKWDVTEGETEGPRGM